MFHHLADAAPMETTIDTVTGHHGTTKERAIKIRAEGFLASRNDYDWLGTGIYFFERAPSRAHEWACRLCGPDDEATVIEATIELRDCMDLTDLDGVEALRELYGVFVNAYGRERLRKVRQNKRAPRFDCMAINYACTILEERGQPVRVLRAAFAEGDPIWSDPEGELSSSAILDRSHVQLAVRDPEIIVEYHDHAVAR
jgi:hypothetical protein